MNSMLIQDDRHRASTALHNPHASRKPLPVGLGHREHFSEQDGAKPGILDDATRVERYGDNTI